MFLCCAVPVYATRAREEANHIFTIPFEGPILDSLQNSLWGWVWLVNTGNPNLLSRIQRLLPWVAVEINRLPQTINEEARLKLEYHMHIVRVQSAFTRFECV